MDYVLIQQENLIFGKLLKYSFNSLYSVYID